MRSPILTTVFFSVLSTCHVIEPKAQPGYNPSTLTIPSATPASIASSNVPAATQVLDDSVLEGLELRQVAAAPAAPAAPAAAPPVNPAAPANPAVPPVVNPAAPANPGVAPAVNPNPAAAPPASTITAAPIPDPTAEQISETVQWVETHIGTVHTWVPVTITMRFGVVISQAALPGKGAIGMGTIKGEVGVTKTIVAGAAPTHGIEWRGIAAAVGVGLAGLVV